MTSTRIAPDFIIAGAWKSGSSALAEALKCHPDIEFSNRNEPNFFSRHFDEGLSFYAAYFDAKRTGLRGEGSVGYLEQPEVPQRIKQLLPSVRLVFILRHPVDRAISTHNWHRAIGKPLLSWDEELALGAAAPALNSSRYGTHIARFLDQFDREQILIVRTEDLLKRGPETLQRVFRHIGASPREQIVPRETNLAVRPRSQHLARALGATHDLLAKRGAGSARYPVITLTDRVVSRLVRANQRPLENKDTPPHVRARLHALFDPEVRKLEQVVGEDYSAWIAP